MMFHRTSGKSGFSLRALTPVDEHPNVLCDVCDQPINVRARFKCMFCLNFDVCADCEPLGKHDASHPLLKIASTRVYKNSALLMNRSNLIHPDTTCKHCGQTPITGMRYRCVQCGVDVCEICDFKGAHPLDHVMERTVFPTLSSLAKETQARVEPKPPPTPAPPGRTISSVSDAIHVFSLRVYERLLAQSGSSNVLYSPASVAMALFMLIPGARGSTHDALCSALYVNNIPPLQLHSTAGQLQKEYNKEGQEYTLNMVNSAYVDQRSSLHRSYAAQISQYYQAGVIKMDFRDAEGSRNTINKQIELQTHALIKDLLPPGSINADTLLVLTNALYFKGTWMRKFDSNCTRPEVFHGSTGDKTIPFMHQTLTVPFALLFDVAVVELGYKGQRVAMDLFVPQKVDGLARFEAALSSGQSLNTWLEKLAPVEVALSLPKFKLEPDSISLTSILKDLGMGPAFSADADFSALSEMPVKISDVIHKAFCTVDEAGTEAAAATAIPLMQSLAMRIRKEPLEVRCDRPFMFVLRDRVADVPLFIGRYACP